MLSVRTAACGTYILYYIHTVIYIVDGHTDQMRLERGVYPFALIESLWVNS